MLHSKSFCSFTQTGILIVMSFFGLRRIISVLFIIVTPLALLAGCGVKGPLYMPDYPAKSTENPASSTAMEAPQKTPDSKPHRTDTSPVTP